MALRRALIVASILASALTTVRAATTADQFPAAAEPITAVAGQGFLIAGVGTVAGPAVAAGAVAPGRSVRDPFASAPRYAPVQVDNPADSPVDGSVDAGPASTSGCPRQPCLRLPADFRKHAPSVYGTGTAFGGPNDRQDNGSTASGISEAQPGVAVRVGHNAVSGENRLHLKGYWLVEWEGRAYVLQQIDLGPGNPGAVIDFSYGALPLLGSSRDRVNDFMIHRVRATYLGKSAGYGAYSGKRVALDAR